MSEIGRYGIDNMQSVCLKEAGVNASGHVEEETTLMGLTFGGYLRSKVCWYMGETRFNTFIQLKTFP